MSVKKYPGGCKEFEEACEAAEVQPTKRQWKKWLKKQGRAWANRKQ